MKALIFICIVLLLSGCKKEPRDEDYRKPYTGFYKFTTVRKGISMCYEPSSTCVDGWEVVNSDTSLITSEIEKFDTNRLKIQFGEGIIGKDDKDSVWEQTVYPILLSNGELSLPEYPIGAGYFKGYFNGNDTLILDIQFGYGIGSYTKYEVMGIREN